MDKQTPSPMQPERPSRQSLWQRLRTTLILWGIIAPPGSEETDLTEKEQKARKQIFFMFRRRPGGRGW